MGEFVEHERVAGTEWKLWRDNDGKYNDANVLQALLQDIRAELQRLNRLLDCPNFRAVPRRLSRIADNTAPKKQRKR